MTSNIFRHPGAYTFVAHVDGDPDCVLLASERHYLASWTMPLDGRREVVAVEIRPKKAGYPGTSSKAKLIKEWLAPATAELARVMPRDPEPITATQLRTIPLRQVMAAREESLRQAGRAKRESLSPITLLTSDAVHDFPKLTPTQREHLMDAVTYVEALNRGSRSPTSAVAERRGIGVHTAHNRIAQARRLGLLTPSTQGKVGGQLTPEAKRLLDAIDTFISANLTDPEKRGDHHG